MGSSSNYTLIFGYLVFLILIWGSQSCNGFGTFGFDIHHRYSDQVKEILDLDGLPEMGSPQYYAAMAHRDRLIRGRRLADTVDSTHLTFIDGNETYRISSLGFLHYANVFVGTPGLSFLVALDTGSDLFWLPCDCSSCVHGIKTRTGEVIDLNIYSPNTSSTNKKVTCNSTLCGQRRRCSVTPDTCPYQVVYLSNGTSSNGILVEDVLHLTTDDSQLKAVEPRVTFGCGKVQTGSFLDGGAPNGLFGLGMENVSVPSILASEGLVANSFSMCFGEDGMGRISFGDKGSSDQGETPFNLDELHPTYNISMTQIIVGKNVTNLDFSAIFDTGTSFTYINDPAYTEISESFNSQIREKRRPSDSNIPFEYCYELSANQTVIAIPTLNLTMKGGSQFYVTDPIIIVSLKSGYIYCLGVLKSGDINIIGQNFMTGYRIVFDREKMVLGWKESDCYDSKNTTTLPIDPRNSTAVPPTATAPAPAPAPGATVEPEAPPAPAPAPGATVEPEAPPTATAPVPAPAPSATVEPEATPNPGNGSPNSSPSTTTPPPPSSYAPRLNSFTSTLLMVTFSIFIHCFINLIS